MTYTALYRRYRPQDFSSLVGQAHIAKVLSSAISKDNVVHAYLFCGPRGTGKTSAARIFARAINCQKLKENGNPCSECPSCTRALNGESMDLIEIDGASNRGIDEVRDLRERVKYAPAQEKYKIYIIDEVHMLTNDAFNALLKTLEEPPAHVIFILATTAPHKLPMTVLSRCQRFDFHRISDDDIKDHLLEIAATEKIEISDEAASIIAKKADGGMRDAVSLLDQCSATHLGIIDTNTINSLLGLVDHSFILGLRNHLLNKDLAYALVDVEELISSGKDLRQALADLCESLRDGLLAQLADKETSSYPAKTWLELLSVLAETDNKLRFAASPRITLELALIKACDLKEAPMPIKTTPKQDDQSAKKQETKINAAIPIAPTDEQTMAKPIAQDKKIKSNPSTSSLQSEDKSSDIIELWPNILNNLEQQSSGTFYLVENCQLSLLNGKELLLEFPKDRKNDCNYIMGNHDHLSTLKNTILQICGQEYQVKGQLGSFHSPKEIREIPTSENISTSHEKTQVEGNVNQDSLF